MPAISTIALVATALAAASTAETANETKRHSEQVTRGQGEQQSKLMEEAKVKQTQDATNADAQTANAQARARQRTMARNAQGRAGTILAGGLGGGTDMSQAPVGGKTLLGA